MLEIRDLSKAFFNGHEQVKALSRVNVTVEQGKLYGLLGPSGCGKSTLLRCVAGLETPTSGEISVRGRVVYSSGAGTDMPVYRRRIGMVFQSYAIWPHMDVFHNVAFPLMYGSRRFSGDDISRRVNNALAMVQLSDKRDRMAPLLSGGQQQRVALARALVYEPDLLLLDEPLSNLDAQLRVEMRREIRDLVRKFDITTVFVTHDQAEALSISDRVAILQDGHLVQEGSPVDVYSRPQNRFVANFVGTANIIDGLLRKADDGQCSVSTSLGALRGIPVAPMPDGAPASIVIRAEAVHLAASDMTRLGALDAEVKSVSFTGDATEVELRVHEQFLVFKLPGLHRLARGEALRVYVDGDRCPIIPA